MEGKRVKLVILSGPICAGKTRFRDAMIRHFNAEKVSTSAWLLEMTGCENERGALQKAGAVKDRETAGRWVVDVVKNAVNGANSNLLILDSVRTSEQVLALREEYGESLFHVHLNADPALLERRYAARNHEHKEFATYAEARRHGTEANIDKLSACANTVLEADQSSAETLAVTAMAMNDVKVPSVERLVDVIVGAQYGSEGKGNICAYIAHEYDALMRIGGPNAGHSVFNPPYKYVQLPSGTGSNQEAKILIGAGSTLWLPTLLKEIADHPFIKDKLTIDPQAMIIDDWDRRAESEGLMSIATTKQGVGAASARKIVNRGDPAMLGPATRLARDIPQLEEWIGDVREELSKLYRAEKRVLLEGTQGTALSIHHGPYPFVTSRETSASGCMADAGISHQRIRKVIMVVRTFPIRVGGTSGWMGRELKWEQVAERSGIPLEDLKEAEKGTVSKRLRRIGEFDWGQLRRSTELNGATDIALTFADYLGVGNRNADDFYNLNPKTQEFIRQIEKVAGVKVSMVSKAFASDGVIKRGTWN